MSHFIACVAVALTLLPVTALAQARPPARPAAPRPAASASATPTLGRVNASAVAPGIWRYRTTMNTAGGPRTLDRTLTLTRTTRAGTAAWLVVDAQRAGEMSIVDSLWVARATMAPLHRVLTPAGGRIVTTFVGDTIKGMATTPQGDMPFLLPNRPGLIVSASMLELALAATPLRRGWRSTANLLAVAPTGSGVVPVELSVVGEERVTVPGGTFESWIIETRGAPIQQRLWLSKTGRRVVKMSQSTGQPGSTAIETVLLR